MGLQKILRERTYITRIAFTLLAVLLLGAAFFGQTASAETEAGPPPCKLIISEFRVRGPNGANDEFIEIYNNGGPTHVVQTADGSAGYALVASDGMTRFIIPNGTVIPGRGHYLGVNSAGYSIHSYPAGNGATATGDVTYTMDIPDNAGIALFRTANPLNFTQSRRLDAVGSTSEANMLYKEGSGYLTLTPFSIDYSFYRDLATGFPKDTNSNAADFVFVDTNGTSAGAGQRLGTPGPENSSSPIRRAGTFAISRLDPAVCVGCPPNHVRDFTSDPANNSTFGTISVVRKFTNKTDGPINRLRFRITEIATFPSPSGTADLRPRTSTAKTVTLTSGNVTLVNGTTFEEPPSQPNGGGFNSTFSVDAVKPATPLAPGASVKVRFLLGVQQPGKYRFTIISEAHPFSKQAVYTITGDTEHGGEHELRTVGDYDGDNKTDIAVWKPATGGWSIVRSAGGPTAPEIFGKPGDKPVPGDYDGDGKVDLAVFRPSNRTWYIRHSSDEITVSKQWGLATDLPVPADYDGDGHTDIALYRESSGVFIIIKSSTNTEISKVWGGSGDIPVPGDYDGDHQTDYAIFRPSTHLWRILRSSDKVSVTQSFGVSTDVPVFGDYDKDGMDDIAVWRPSTGFWFVLQSSNNSVLSAQWGVFGDQPQVGDFDGDGKYDFAVWRASNSTWYLRKSSELAASKRFGESDHLPVSSAILVP
jgi:hypothetical protein